MEQFTFTNASGRSITIDYEDKKYILQSYEGLTPADIEGISIKGYNQNGYTLDSLTIGQRRITLNFYLYADTPRDFYRYRANLANIFNPLLGLGTLEYTNDYLSRCIECYTTILPTVTQTHGKLSMINLELTCPDPFWHDKAESVATISMVSGGLTFPLKFNDSEKFGKIRGTRQVSVKNAGDVATPVRIEFANSGTSTAIVNPKVTNNTTKEYIKINDTIDANHRCYITTGYGNKDVVLTDTNGSSSSVYNMVDTKSTFFSLRPGTNKIAWSCSSGEPYINIYWYNRYMGC